MFIMPCSGHHLGFQINTWNIRGRRGRDRMVVGFTTTYAISAYHHWCCEFESRSGRRVQHYVIKCVSDLWQVGGFFRVLRFPLQNYPPRYNWNIVESGIKHHQTNKQTYNIFIVFSYKMSEPWILGHTYLRITLWILLFNFFYLGSNEIINMKWQRDI